MSSKKRKERKEEIFQESMARSEESEGGRTGCYYGDRGESNEEWLSRSGKRERKHVEKSIIPDLTLTEIK